MRTAAISTTRPTLPTVKLRHGDRMQHPFFVKLAIPVQIGTRKAKAKRVTRETNTAVEEVRKLCSLATEESSSMHFKFDAESVIRGTSRRKSNREPRKLMPSTRFQLQKPSLSESPIAALLMEN